MARDNPVTRKANHMNKLVTLTLTDDDCLNVRMALNGTAMDWADKASAHRAKGDDVDAATCERIRSDYHRLWDLVNEAQEAAAKAAPDPRLAWFEPDAVSAAIEYLDLAHGDSNPAVNDVIARLAPRTASQSD
jgi:hypothetical protein